MTEESSHASPPIVLRPPLELCPGPGEHLLLAGEGYEIAHFQLGEDKTLPREEGVAAVVLHYTAAKASERPVDHLERFEQVLEPEGIETVSALAQRLGHIPSGLSLSLQNARSDRKACWDFLVGDDGVIVQGNLELRQRHTRHAGRRRSRYLKRGKDLYYTDPWTHERHLVWDASARSFRYPVFPDGSVPTSGNTRTIGIEIENYGRVHLRGGRYYRRAGYDAVKRKYKYVEIGLSHEQVVKIGNRYYERLSDATMRSLIALMGALRDTFSLPEGAWFGHLEFTPDQRTDPSPPLNIPDLVEQLYEPAEYELVVMEPLEIVGELGPDGFDDYDPDDTEDLILHD